LRREEKVRAGVVGIRRVLKVVQWRK